MVGTPNDFGRMGQLPTHPLLLDWLATRLRDDPRHSLKSEPPTCPSGDRTRHPYRQRYQCQACPKHFDDLTDTIFEGHHQPLKVWVLCLYFMGLNLSNQQIAKELGLNQDDLQQMTTQLRHGVVEKKSR